MVVATGTYSRTRESRARRTRETSVDRIGLIRHSFGRRRLQLAVNLGSINRLLRVELAFMGK